MALTLAHCVWPLPPPEGAAALTAWQSQVRGLCLEMRESQK